MLPQEARLRGGIVVWLLRCVDTVRYVVCLHGKTTRVFFPSSPVFCFGVGVFGVLRCFLSPWSWGHAPHGASGSAAARPVRAVSAARQSGESGLSAQAVKARPAVGGLRAAGAPAGRRPLATWSLSLVAGGRHLSSLDTASALLLTGSWMLGPWRLRWRAPHQRPRGPGAGLCARLPVPHCRAPRPRCALWPSHREATRIAVR